MFETLAYAQAAAQPASEVNPLMSMMPFVLIFIIFYFFLIRPQQKRQQELGRLIADLKKGDRIVTSGGMIGTIHSIQNDYVVIKVGDNENTKMEVLKSAVSGLRHEPK